VLMQKLRALNREKPDPVAPVPPKINPDDFPLCLAAYTPAQITPFTPRSANSISLDAAHPRTFIVDIFRPPKA